jgi:two-component system sensor histidine kinase FlrB
MNAPAFSSAASLQDAFQVFNELSQNLSRSYAELEAQAMRLTQELAAARSERLQTLMEKERLAKRLQHLLEALPGGVLVADGQGRVVEHNPAAAALLGEALQGKLWRDALDRASLPAPETPRQRELRDGKTISLAVRPLGEEPGQIVLLTDVSEMRALQELASQQKRLSMLGEMVASLAHQVRTPLAAALLYTSNLAAENLTQAQRARFAGKLQERLEHLERQVNDMLVFARVGKLELAPIEACELLRKTHEAFAPTLAGKPIRLNVAIDARLAPGIFHGAADALQGALLNLLNNAVEAFNGAAGVIELQALRLAPGWLRLMVTDNGPGIPFDIQGRIFEAFFTTRPSGTGLGLAIVDCIARAQGGRVSLHSNPGQGASFRLDFPTATESSLLPGGYSQDLEAEQKDGKL